MINPVNYCSKPGLKPALAGFALWPAIALGTLKDDVGFTALSNTLAANLPTASGVTVFQIEAGDNWVADSANSEFSGKTIAQLWASSPATSSHATTVGKLFYGNNSSLSPGITDIGAHSVNGWFFDELQFDYPNPGTPKQKNRRVANHSWIGTGFVDTSGNFFAEANSVAFRMSDWYCDVDEVIQVFGSNNNNNFSVNADRLMMASTYNGIVAGVTDGTHALGIVALDAVYTDGRAPVHLVVPATNTSNSAPTIASAAALLISAAQTNAGWSESSTSNRLGTTIYNAERVETIKAALMAGASRSTNNSTAQGNIVDYRYHESWQTDNGLDWRYGAGQLNVANSYAILAAGEKPAQEDNGTTNIGFTGFDHNQEFGGAQGNESTAVYDLGTTTAAKDLTAALVWNLSVDPTPNFSNPATLYNINLELFNVDTATVVATSQSEIDNSQNIWFTLEPNTHYQLRVSKAGSQSNFNFDYSIAWLETEPTIITNVPITPMATFAVLFSASFLYQYRKKRLINV